MKTRQKIEYDNGAVVQQSMIYTDPYRILAEYVDNSIDASEVFYKEGSYETDILITVKKHTEGTVSIEDNATGMDYNPDQPYRIFRSGKSNDPKTNGKFGFGMFSFLSICNRLEVRTWNRSAKMYHGFAITSNDFISGEDKSPEIEVESYEFTDDDLGGTEMVMSEFHVGQFEDISIETFKTEIQKHFELVLQRPGITINLIDESDKAIKCETFPYGQYCSSPLELMISRLEKTHSKRIKSVKEYDVSASPAKIFLIASASVEFDRPVFFVVKGRRVSDVSDIAQFGTRRKFQIWSKSSVTGYIDVTGILDPTISRKDFVSNETSKAFFKTLLGYEDRIQEYIDSQTHMESTVRVRDLESKINEALKEFTQQEGSKGNNAGNSRGKRIFTIKGVSARARSEAVPHQDRDNTPRSNSSGHNRITNRAGDRNKDHRIELLSNIKRSDAGPTQLEVRIDSNNEPHTDLAGIPLRSISSGNTIYIFKKHEDFQNRVKSSPKGYEVVTQRLIVYIALEVAMHYTDRNTNQSPNGSNENRLRQFVSAVLKLEENLKSLDGMKI